MEAEALYARVDTDSDDDGVNLDDEYSEEEGESGSQMEMVGNEHI